jgi:hypothetical protein
VARIVADGPDGAVESKSSCRPAALPSPPLILRGGRAADNAAGGTGRNGDARFPMRRARAWGYGAR